MVSAFTIANASTIVSAFIIVAYMMAASELYYYKFSESALIINFFQYRIINNVHLLNLQ